VGAKATPRRTSPAAADRTVVKWPNPPPVGKVVADSRSVTFKAWRVAHLEMPGVYAGVKNA
jgi:hypothetical protein